MASLWTDLRTLHGRLFNLGGFRRRAGPHASAPPPTPPRQADDDAGAPPVPARGARGRRRLCLGIGDGEVRRQ